MLAASGSFELGKITCIVSSEAKRFQGLWCSWIKKCTECRQRHVLKRRSMTSWVVSGCLLISKEVHPIALSKTQMFSSLASKTGQQQMMLPLRNLFQTKFLK
jgi:hypothetical protein